MSENEQNDPVITDDEKEALLDGVESGEVEVQTDGGRKYATVTEFAVAPRNRIVTNSFTRMLSLNRKLAGHIGKSASTLLNEKADVASGPMTICTWGEFGEQVAEVALIYAFEPKPLEGVAVVFMQKSLVGHLVEVFYGGSRDNPPRHEAGNFTPGECSVVSLFCEGIVNGITQTWQGLMALQPELSSIHQSTDIVEVIENSAAIISSEFDIHFEDEQFYFHIVWPLSTLSSLLPVLEGQKRDRDPAEDARWAQVLRARMPDAKVAIDTCVGSASMTLRQVSKLEPGDIIDIENPRKATVFAEFTPLIEGRFGVHDGCYALEATRWLSAATDEPTS